MKELPGDAPIEMVLVDQDEGYRAVGIATQAELEELERMHDAGDIRAEARLALLLRGRQAPMVALVVHGTWNNLSR